MYHLTCHCHIKPDRIGEAINHTLEWIPKLQEKYDEPVIYEAFQDVQSPSHIIYFITHSSFEDERKMANTDEPRKFGKILYEMCTKEPKWLEHNMVNSIRNQNRQSQLYSRVEYKVKEDKIDNITTTICHYIDKVRDTESDIYVYESYQNKEDLSKFIHLAQFKNNDAEQYHKNQKHTKKFIEFLYPLCEVEPKFIYMNLIGAVKR